MEHDLDKADEIIRRLDATYAEAYEALNATGGDVLAALAHIEQARAKPRSDLSGLMTDTVSRALTTAREGMIRSVRLKLAETTVREFAVSLTGLAAAAVVCVGAMVSQCTIEVDGADESTE